MYELCYRSIGEITTDERETYTTERYKHSEMTRAAGNMAIIYGGAHVIEGYKRGEVSETEFREHLYDSVFLSGVLDEKVQEQHTAFRTELRDVDEVAGWMVTLPGDNGELAVMDIRSEDKYLHVFFSEIEKMGVTRVFVNPARVSPLIMFWLITSIPERFAQADQHFLIK